MRMTTTSVRKTTTSLMTIIHRRILFHLHSLFHRCRLVHLRNLFNRRSLVHWRRLFHRSSLFDRRSLIHRCSLFHQSILVHRRSIFHQGIIDEDEDSSDYPEFYLSEDEGEDTSDYEECDDTILRGLGYSGFDEQVFDRTCIFGNVVALNIHQTVLLRSIAEELPRPRTKEYVCTLTKSNVIPGECNLEFTPEYTSAYLLRFMMNPNAERLGIPARPQVVSLAVCTPTSTVKKYCKLKLQVSGKAMDVPFEAVETEDELPLNGVAVYAYKGRCARGAYTLIEGETISFLDNSDDFRIESMKAPGKGMDIYMQLVIDELLVLWNDGVLTHDAAFGRKFHLYTVLLWTISDWQGRAVISEYEEGRPVGRVELFFATHLNSKGHPVSKYTAKKMVEVKKFCDEDKTLISDDEALYTEVFPRAKASRTHGLGLVMGGKTTEKINHLMTVLDHAEEEKIQLRGVVQNLVEKSEEIEKENIRLRDVVQNLMATTKQMEDRLNNFLATQQSHSNRGHNDQQQHSNQQQYEDQAAQTNQQNPTAQDPHATTEQKKQDPHPTAQEKQQQGTQATAEQKQQDPHPTTQEKEQQGPQATAQQKQQQHLHPTAQEKQQQGPQATTQQKQQQHPHPTAQEKQQQGPQATAQQK
ncbi:hypothetical protein ACQ4PT_035333 [Festuca glaucescens]